MLGADTAIAEPHGLVPRQPQHPPGRRRQPEVSARVITDADDLLNLLPYRLDADPEPLQCPDRRVLTVLQEAAATALVSGLLPDLMPRPVPH